MRVDALAMDAGTPLALVDVDAAVVPVEALVAFAAVGIPGAHADAVASAGVAGAVVHLGAVCAFKWWKRVF